MRRRINSGRCFSVLPTLVSLLLFTINTLDVFAEETDANAYYTSTENTIDIEAFTQQQHLHLRTTGRTARTWKGNTGGRVSDFDTPVRRNLKGDKGNKNPANNVQETSESTPSFSDEKPNKGGKNDKKNDKKNPGGDSTFSEETESGLPVITNGIAETKPCLPWSSIVQNQKENEQTSDVCRNLDDGYPFGSGCCRSYWWLLIDTKGTLYPSLPCICNDRTRDPSLFETTATTTTTVAPVTPAPTTSAPMTSAPATLAPTTSAPVTLAPPTSEPTGVPAPVTPPPITISPTWIVPESLQAMTQSPAISVPTTLAPTSSSPTSNLTGTLVATTEPPTPTAAAAPALETCAVQEQNIYWNEETFPEYADKTRCLNSQHCLEKFGSDSCCVAKYCLCGMYRPGTADQVCVSMNGVADLEAFLHQADDATGANQNEDADPVMAPAPLAPAPTPATTLEPTFSVVGALVPTTETQATSTTTETPAPNTCAVPEQNVYWNKQSFPQYADKTRCTESMSCLKEFGSGSCCLADFCLCGAYRKGFLDQECVSMNGVAEGESHLPGADANAVPVPSPAPTIPATLAPTTTPASPTPPESLAPTTPPPASAALTTPAPTTTPPTTDLCVSNAVWDSQSQCTTSQQCRGVPNTCCLVTLCLCGYYRPGYVNEDCIP